MVGNIFQDSFDVFKEVVATWESFEEFVPKFQKIAENIAKIGKKSYIANKPGHGFNVLNHADFHTRNILVKQNQERRIESFSFVS